MAVEHHDVLLDRLRPLEQKQSIDERLDGLSTIRKLGSGSHGRCFLMQRDDGQLVVHKRIPVSHMSATDQEVAEREVNILASLQHPFIVLYDRAFVQQGQLCIAMEYAGGGDLSHRLDALREADQCVELTQALDWFTQLLLALRYVHGYRVLHRDLALKKCAPLELNPVRPRAESHRQAHRKRRQSRAPPVRRQCAASAPPAPTAVAASALPEWRRTACVPQHLPDGGGRAEAGRLWRRARAGQLGRAGAHARGDAM